MKKDTAKLSMHSRIVCPSTEQLLSHEDCTIALPVGVGSFASAKFDTSL